MPISDWLHVFLSELSHVIVWDENKQELDKWEKNNIFESMRLFIIYMLRELERLVNYLWISVKVIIDPRCLYNIL